MDAKFVVNCLVTHGISNNIRLYIVVKKNMAARFVVKCLVMPAISENISLYIHTCEKEIPARFVVKHLAEHLVSEDSRLFIAARENMAVKSLVNYFFKRSSKQTSAYSFWRENNMTASYIKKSLVKECNLRRHHLEIINRNRHICQICGKMFSLGANLRIAVRKKLS